MKNYSRIAAFIAGIALVASFVLSPSFAFAKQDNKGNQGDNERKEQNIDNENEDMSNDTGCLRAFGHLIAPGWIKHNGQLSVGEECSLPFGIGRKFNGGEPTTTPPVVDTTAPIISSLTVSPRLGDAVVRWTTNENANSEVFYSLNTPVDLSSSSTHSIVRGALVTDHRVVIGPLSASTTYYVIVRSHDASGNVSTSSETSLTTLAPQSTSDTTPPVISAIVSVPGTTSVQVGWTTDEFATSRVYYGASSTIDVHASTTTFVGSASLDKNHLVNVSPLTASTTYYFIVESVDASGNISRSSVFSATTGTPAPVVDTTAPVISNAVAIVGSTNVALSWNTNENATTKAYYSTTTPVDVSASTTPFVENVSLVSAHTLNVPGLATSTLYHMVLESKDASNNTARTSEFSFTTAGI